MPYGESTSTDVERIAKIIVDAAYRVHTQTGPGLLECVYEVCLAHELTKRGLSVRRQVKVPIIYDGVQLDADLRIDLLVEEKLIVEIKSVERTIPVFEAQVLTYLKLTRLPLALMINFNVALIKDGIKRIILSQQYTRCEDVDL